ncbi:MAG: SHOCT domain-containing protein [Bacteroidetes bacterium]|nr:SHOCT domain-containing protein [Bacteroidota bacterium]
MILAFGVIVTCCFSTVAIGQVKSSVKKTAPARTSLLKINIDKIKIDSLEAELEDLKVKLDISDSLFDAETFVTADLRDQIIKLDDYRKKLENTIDSYKGENLKLNQSNRILIVFNSLVAILLVISLVFFLKKIGSGKLPKANGANEFSNNPTGNKISALSLEDKLQQLERLGKLREKGLLSESEFLAEKQNILGK